MTFSFIRDLGHTGDITYLTDVNVHYLHQPWRAFATIINKCLSGKEAGMDKIRLFRAQILWDAKKTNKMSYPRFIKIIIDYFMLKDQSISRRNKMFWHTARDDTMFTSMRCISIHEDTHVYGTILLRELTNQAMLESKAYQTYYAFASREKAPKPKYIRKKANSDTSPKKKPVQAAKGTILKSKAKVAKPEKKKRPAKKTKANVLDVLSETSGTDEGTGTIPGVPDVPPYESKSNKESWGDSQDEDGNEDGDNDEDCKSDDHDDDSDDERIESDSDEIPDPNLTNVDQAEYEEEDVDDRVRTPSDYELTDEEKIDDEETMDDQEYDEVIKELYGDVNVNLGNDDTEMIDADQRALKQQNKADKPVQSSSVSSDFTSKLLNHENPSLADNEIASLMETLAHHATVIPEITSGFTTTTPPPTPFFNPLLQQQTSTFTTTTSINPTVTLPEILNFASVFNSLFNSGIVDMYLASKKKEATDVAIQLQTNKLREEAQADNQEFLNQVDSTMKTIIKDQVKAQVSTIMPKIEKYVTVALGAEVLVRSTNQPQTSYVVATSLSEFKLKKILIDKTETNKSIDRSDNQKNLYNALVESYNSNKDIITSYGDVVILKRGRDDQDKDEDLSAGSYRGTKRRKSGKDAESSKDSRSNEKKSSSTSKDASQSQHKSSGKSAYAKEPSHIVEDSGMQQDQEFVTGDNNEEPADKETWISQVVRAEEPPTSFDEFNDTSFDFSAFVLNRLKIPNLTQEILVGPAFNLLKGICKSITELEYHLEECSKATTERLDRHNPENKPYPFDLRKPLPLIQDHRGRQIIPKDYFINKDLEYLKGGDLSRRYSTSVTKTKAATYELK
ncbi:hypothetical protein Tco_0941190 [Tanacetum coccineum]|uniref:Uncharacterized protein n=1 Tax=Tanacetum coccineum TaxID=301880 RepID=A0ABQ5DQ66_9ASTR